MINDDPVLSLNWQLYKEMLALAKKEYLIKEFCLNDAVYDQSFLDDISDFAFNKGFDDYMYLVGINTLYGWRKFDDDTEIINKIKDWLCNDFKPTYNGCPDLFLQKFREKIRDIFRYKEGTLEQEESAEEYCINITQTSTAGSAYDPGGDRAHVYYDGEPVKIRNTKFAKSAYLSTKEKMKRLFKMEKQKSNVSIKTEFYPKVRLIVSSSYDIFLKMKFVDSWLSKWMSGYSKTTLFQSKHDTYQMWVKFAEKVGWNIPLDQKQFDHKQTTAMVLIIIEEIINLLEDKGINCAEVIEVAKTLRYALDGGMIYFKDSKGEIHQFNALSGIQSGWYWTALFDTLCNIAEVGMSEDLAKENGITCKPLLFNAQGDDDLLRYDSLLECISTFTSIRTMGFVVNPRKTFYSKHHNEYLRKYAYNNMVNGYPARMINNINWLYPGEVIPKLETEKLSGTTNKWIKLAERLKIPRNRITNYLIKDLCGMKIARAMVDKFFNTHKMYGGIRESSEKQTFKMDTTGGEILGKVTVEGQGYNEFKLHFGRFQERELESWMLKALDIPDESHHHKIYSERSLAFSPISLPKELAFNIYPTMPKLSTRRKKEWGNNVIFGKSRELMEYVFPDLNSFTQMGHAPRSWIYNYLTGKLKILTPKVSTMSEEFSSLLWEPYAQSIISAMYHKKHVENKWDRLQLYAYNNFESILKGNGQQILHMY